MARALARPVVLNSYLMFSTDAAKPSSSPAMEVAKNIMSIFTCNVCQTREGYRFSKDSYERGVVIVRCPGCRSLHLVAGSDTRSLSVCLHQPVYPSTHSISGSIDNLGWFGPRKNLETIAAEKSKQVLRLNDVLPQLNELLDEHHRHILAATDAVNASSSSTSTSTSTPSKVPISSTVTSDVIDGSGFEDAVDIQVEQEHVRLLATFDNTLEAVPPPSSNNSNNPL